MNGWGTAVSRAPSFAPALQMEEHLKQEKTLPQSPTLPLLIIDWLPRRWIQQLHVSRLIDGSPFQFNQLICIYSVDFKCVVAAVYLGPWFQLEKLTLNEPHHQGNYRLQTSLDDVEHKIIPTITLTVILWQEAERQRKNIWIVPLFSAALMTLFSAYSVSTGVTLPLVSWQS